MKNIDFQEILKKFPDDYQIRLADWSDKKYMEHPMLLSKWDVSVDAKDKSITLGKSV